MMNSDDKKNFPWKGSNQILEEKGQATDVNGNELNLSRGTYEIMSYKSDVMIRKGSDVTSESYDLLRDFRHDNAIQLLDYYTDGARKGCLVIPKVSTSFLVWFQNGGNKLLFNESGHMTVLFKNMIIGLCSLVDSLTKRKIIIEKFAIEDMYFSLASQDLSVLLTQVKQAKVVGVVIKNNNWNHIKEFISWCEKNCYVKMDNLTKSFCQYIGKSYFKVEYLNNYPDDWDDEMKGEYLMALVASNHKDMRTFLNNAEIDWPYIDKDSHNLPNLIERILDWEEEKNDRKYNTLDRLSYVILLRNLYKHHGKLPSEIKAVLINRKSLIGRIEQWNPGIWIKIYERAGCFSTWIKSHLQLILIVLNSG